MIFTLMKAVSVAGMIVLAVIVGLLAATLLVVEVVSSAEPATDEVMVAVGEDAESAHTKRKECNRRSSSPWGWRITHVGMKWHDGKWYVIKWHDPKWYNPTGRFHTNISVCSSREMEPAYIPSP
jgi:hypothetical protein